MNNFDDNCRCKSFTNFLCYVLSTCPVTFYGDKWQLLNGYHHLHFRMLLILDLFPFQKKLHKCWGPNCSHNVIFYQGLRDLELATWPKTETALSHERPLTRQPVPARRRALQHGISVFSPCYRFYYRLCWWRLPYRQKIISFTLS